MHACMLGGFKHQGLSRVPSASEAHVAWQVQGRSRSDFHRWLRALRCRAQFMLVFEFMAGGDLARVLAHDDYIPRRSALCPSLFLPWPAPF